MMDFLRGLEIIAGTLLLLLIGALFIGALNKVGIDAVISSTNFWVVAGFSLCVVAFFFFNMGFMPNTKARRKAEQQRDTDINKQLRDKGVTE